MHILSSWKSIQETDKTIEDQGQKEVKTLQIALFQGRELVPSASKNGIFPLKSTHDTDR